MGKFKMPKGNQKLFEFLDPLQWQKAFLKEFFGDIVMFASDTESMQETKD